MNTQIIVRNLLEQQGHVVLLISLIHVDEGIQGILSTVVVSARGLPAVSKLFTFQILDMFLTSY